MNATWTNRSAGLRQSLMLLLLAFASGNAVNAPLATTAAFAAPAETSETSEAAPNLAAFALELLDAKTGDGIEDVRLELTLSDGKTPPISEVLATDDQGRCTIRFEHPELAWVRIITSHPDYLSDRIVAHQTQLPDTSSEPHTLRLVKQQTYPGIVRTPAGEPVAGAEVLIRTTDKGFRLGKATVKANWGEEISPVKTDEQGEFSLLLPPEAEALYVIDQQGYAELSPQEWAASPEITLQPWGRIEGILKADSEAGTKRKVVVNPGDGWRSGVRYTGIETETDTEGRFVIDFVPPGSRRVYWMKPQGENSWTGSDGMTVVVEPGEATRVQLGGQKQGRPVVGRFVASPADYAIAWGDRSQGQYRLSTPLPPLVRPFPDEDFQAFDPEQEGPAIDEIRNYSVVTQPDGSFRIEGVEAGKYELKIRVFQPFRDRRGSGSVYGELTREVVVPEIPGGASAEPLDLGRVEVQFEEPGQVGSNAPEFALQTMDGQLKKRSDYDGKWLLLNFWSTSANVPSPYLPELLAVHKEFADDPRLSIFGLCLVSHRNEPEDLPRQFIKEHGISWPQAVLRADQAQEICLGYGVSSRLHAVLIDPQGKIAARGLRGEEIPEAVAKFLGRK